MVKSPRANPRDKNNAEIRLSLLIHFLSRFTLSIALSILSRSVLHYPALSRTVRTVLLYAALPCSDLDCPYFPAVCRTILHCPHCCLYAALPCSALNCSYFPAVCCAILHCPALLSCMMHCPAVSCIVRTFPHCAALSCSFLHCPHCSPACCTTLQYPALSIFSNSVVCCTIMHCPVLLSALFSPVLLHCSILYSVLHYISIVRLCHLNR